MKYIIIVKMVLYQFYGYKYITKTFIVFFFFKKGFSLLFKPSDVLKRL